MPHEPINIDVLATLTIDPRDEGIVSAWDIEELRRSVYEITATTEEVYLMFGNTRVRAKIRFITPTPLELKEGELARDARR
jgi:hypothetical protein